MAINYDKWDKTYNISESDVESMNSRKDGEFEKVPFGKYEVKLTNLELKENSKGNPMIAARFKVIKGSQKGRVIFYNKVVTSSSMIHFGNEFLRSLDSGIDFHWTGSYREYSDTIEMIYNEVKDNTEYVIEYQSENGYDTVKIEDVFDVE